MSGGDTVSRKDDPNASQMHDSFCAPNPCMSSCLVDPMVRRNVLLSFFSHFYRPFVDLEFMGNVKVVLDRYNEGNGKIKQKSSKREIAAQVYTH